MAKAAPREQRPDVKNSVVLAFAIVILAFTAISGVAIWAAASFEGGQPGITAPADGHREDPVIRPADRTRPPAPEETTEPVGEAKAGEPKPATPAEDPRTPQPQTGRGNERPAPVDWTAVAYPMDCSGAPFEIRDARPLAPGSATHIVQVRCAAGAGAAPDAVYAYTVAPDGTAARDRTLLDTEDDKLVKSLDIKNGRVTATVLGYSTEDIPRCCPDIEETRDLTP
ncbi:hypothetical protein [Yinghuangia soli]|uniref:Uncharacterized protein n=1 Tax=Yinghuangia soli TaxID=2908204 RepID=A0AA41PX20_9ACTN|nr:hypothetical protein [Yinghuangia soli]MCF2527419.1 hypothetical protein [Yinghuangia soli]